jgi:hypothetical protein
VRGLHVAAGVDARTARRGAELVDDELTDALDRVLAVTGEELRQLRIAGELAEKIIGDRSECIVTADALVERGRLRRHGLRRHGLLRGGRCGYGERENDGGQRGRELHEVPPSVFGTKLRTIRRTALSGCGSVRRPRK